MRLQEHIPTPMDEADVANVAEQMVVAVDFLHQAGYAHCDIKVGRMGCALVEHSSPLGAAQFVFAHAHAHACLCACTLNSRRPTSSWTCMAMHSWVTTGLPSSSARISRQVALHVARACH